MRRKAAVLASALLLAACTVPETAPPAAAPPAAAVENAVPAFAAVKPDVYAAPVGNGVALSLTDGVAVTLAANRAGLDARQIFGEVKDAGLLFFPSSQYLLHVPHAGATDRMPVTVYGRTGGKSLAGLNGVTTPLPNDMTPFGDSRRSFAVLLRAGAGAERFGGPQSKNGAAINGKAVDGFVGGPIVDAYGRVVGIVAGMAVIDDKRYVLAYRLSFVRAELDKIIAAAAGDPD
jgi:hypothetical protein